MKPYQITYHLNTTKASVTVNADSEKHAFLRFWNCCVPSWLPKNVKERIKIDSIEKELA